VKYKLFFKGPLLTRSGYGEQARFALRALRSRPDLFDIHIQPLNWGQTSWITELDDERMWIDQSIEKTLGYIQNNPQPHFDVSFQVTIPNEWQKAARVNVGYTAGMETTQVAHQWISNGNAMDRIVVVSNHSKNTYVNTVYNGTDPQTQQTAELRLTTPVDVVNYPVKDFGECPELDLDLEYDFNFFAMAQFGPRKNLPNTVKWFLDEFHQDNVGLVLKTNIAKNCVMDRRQLLNDMRNYITQAGYPDRKCKIYLLHGDMSDKEVHSIFEHPKIKAFVSFTHGEGFGLPIFEAAYTGLPVVAPGWSGQLDFLVDPATGKSHFYNVEYDIQPIPENVVWEAVIIKESMWAYPREHSAKQQMRRAYAELTSGEENEGITLATQNAERLQVSHAEEKQYAEMVATVCAALGIDPDATVEDDVLEFE
tara:strand:+ start:7362 stop:8630 length:1269 start_codon:yes stop_codon:yes gene_type:complete